jgi:hypothetical protein
MAIIHLEIDSTTRQLRLIVEDEVDIGTEVCTQLSSDQARAVANALLRTADRLDASTFAIQPVN